jgi:signal transduction histidine kinase
MDRIGQTLSIEIEVERQGEHLRLLVKDDGMGFEKTQEEASGIGLRNLRETLALCFRDAGSLKIQNTPGGGAQVCIELPLEFRRA